MNKQKSLLLGVILMLLVLLTAVMFIGSPLREPIRHSNVPLAVKPNPVGGDFTVEILNADLALKDFLGKTVVLYFGYTQCPDICPLTLSTLTDALKQMTATELEAVQALFVSIDPERDNTARLEEYSQYFHEKLMGATAEPDIIKTIADQYGMAYEFIDSDQAPGYIINHSSAIYIINKNGDLARILPFGVSADAILESVREHMLE